ncbi:MAG TPA: hypothetical protein ENJ10_05440 [Caldithrix abyssi]|uniref:DUF302 domain-containing protein n=1 Tax=Caldithrix abyssi TaxID=187145 RepID=A0A7V1PTX0_CALAY|nr:hypothetical protein [Caldithrix abyssi]
MKRLFVFLVLFSLSVQAGEYGVYQFVLTGVKGDLPSITRGITGQASAAGFKVLASYDYGVPEDCGYKGHLILLNDSSYTEQLIAANPLTAPFAATDRINIFQDEAGTHISVVNPHSINRTMLMDDEKYEQLSASHLQKLRKLITSSVEGTPSTKEYGQMREEGFISKTMGVMAGGAFSEKIEDVFVFKNAQWRDVAQQVSEALAQPGPEWGMYAAFSLPMERHSMSIIGVTGRKMEAKSFDIVGAGDDEEREDYDCPGIADAGAYPFSLVVVQDGADVKVRMVTAMYRMKIFFEDAGKWAFMKNMTMPGSLADEVKEMIEKKLK